MEEGTNALKETINSGRHKRSGGILLLFHPSELLRFIPRARSRLFVLLNKSINMEETVSWTDSGLIGEDVPSSSV